MPIALVIDGPEHGRIRLVYGERFIVKQLPQITDHIPYEEVILTDIIYYVHKILFLGFIIRVASVHGLVDEIDRYDVVELLLTDMARQATERPIPDVPVR